MRDLQKYEDWLLLFAAILAAIAESLEKHPRYAVWAVILGAIAKAVFSIVSDQLRAQGGPR